MKSRLAILTLLALAVVAAGLLTGCADDGSSTETRTASGTVSGDLSKVATVSATSPTSGSTASSAVTALSGPSGLINGVSEPQDYSLNLNVGDHYSITLLDAAGAVVAVMEWATSAGGTQTTTVFNVTTGDPIDMGDASVPAGLAAGVVTLISSSNNPLEVTDSDGDGSSDFDDDDDDNDGISDDADDDHDGNGIDDSIEEHDGDDDGTPDIEDGDSHDADNDNDGIDDDSDDDDDNDGIDDDSDDDADGDGVDDDEEDDS